MKISAIKDNNKTLSEALGQPYPYKWTEKSDRRYVAEYGKLMIAFMRRRLVLGKGAGRWTIAFDIDGDEGITGKGDAFKILSTVVAATKEWWGQQDATKVSTIEFSATKGSGEGNGRTALYRRFATQFANDIGFVMRKSDGHTTTATTTYVLTNPNFQLNVSEDGKIVKGVNTTADVQPGETQRQSAKFGNKLNSKGEPPLLNAKAKKNTSPHVLGNLGLAESQQINELFDAPYTYKWVRKGMAWVAKAKTDNDVMLTVEIVQPSAANDAWEITFFTGNGGSFDATGEGDEFKLFATVVAIIKDWYSLLDKKPHVISFSGDKDDTTNTGSRVRLYDRFARQFAKAGGFSLQREEKANSVTWNLKMPKKKRKIPESQQINELFDKVYDWNWQRKSDNGWTALFKPNAKLAYNSILVTFAPMSKGSPNFEVGFDSPMSGNEKHGGGDEFATFSTVIAIMEAFMREHDPAPESLQFAAKREGAAKDDAKIRNNRAELYKKMVSRFAKKHDLEFIWDDVGRMTEFFLRRKDINEAAQDVSAFGVDAATSETDDMIVLDQVKARDRGTGAGTKYMQELTQYADSVGKPITLTPSNSLGGSVARLKKFYKRFGFVEHNGSGKNYEMIRYPRSKSVTESQQLNELFDQPYNWKWKIAPDPVDAGSQAVFTTSGGDPMHVGFDRHDDIVQVDFTKNFGFSATDEGDQFRIFATVMQVISDYVKKADPKVIEFTAEKNPRTNSSSRIKLYKRMVAKFAQQINMNFDTKDNSVETKFKLTKNNMNETLQKPNPEDTLGYKRHEMPQVHKQHYPELFKYLADNGGKMTKGMVAATSLKAVQSEFSDEGIEKMMRKGGVTADGTKKPLLVSSDNYIIDGHHRWLAAWNQKETVPIIKISIPVRKLLQLVQDFKHTTYTGIYKEGVQDEKTSKKRRVNRN